MNNNNVDTNLDKTALDAVNYLQQYIENEKEIKNSYSKLVENYSKLDEKYNSLVTNYEKLKERCIKLEKINSDYQSALGNATNFRLNDNDKNNSFQLTEDILRLQDDLELYVTSLRPNININYTNVKNLLSKYKSKTRLSSKFSDNIPIIKAVLQRHVLETIFGYFSVYANTKNFSEPYSLEALIANKAEELILLTQEFGKTREGNDSITPAAPIKIRQQIYSVLSNRGFSNITIEQGTYEHFFISKFKTKLNEEMEQYRKILDPKKKKEIEEKAPNIILDVFRIFFFRIQTQEPIGQFCWFQNKDKINPSLMDGMWDDDEFHDFEVDICKFPLVGIELNDNINRKIYTHAIIHPQKVQRPNSDEVNTQSKQDSKHRVDKYSNSESNFNVSSQYQPEQDVRAPSKSEFKAVETQSKPEFKPEVDTQPKSELESEVNINPQTQTSPQSTPQLQPQTSPQITPQLQPQTSPQIIPQLQPQTSPQIIPQLQPQTSPQTTPHLQPQTSPQITPHLQPQTSPQTTPHLQPQTSPQTTPQLQPQTSPQITPQLQPQTSPQTTPQLSQTSPQLKSSQTSLEVDLKKEGKKKSNMFNSVPILNNLFK
ncbi:hypothetical protein RhiirA5_460970 [Rhizophagus irregularis]|uniref:Uncharacterized protein n=1 Tax=Rhizophagus irregularis TaxID=588596 RepID=A0A2N0QDW4_9GLOM|nr:hypothetical protein RhiirA5_460970 [Rhizophagus irregularis]